MFCRKASGQRQNQERFARSAAEFISLISVKETNQRKRFVPKANPGSHRRGDFSTGHPCPIEKRRTSCAAPSGSARPGSSEAESHQPPTQRRMHYEAGQKGRSYVVVVCGVRAVAGMHAACVREGHRGATGQLMTEHDTVGL